MSADWLIAAIDRFLTEESRGYILIEGEAGVGKSALAAHLVTTRRWIHHFSELAPGREGVRAALQSLAAQLVLALAISPYQDEDVVPPAAGDPRFLANLLEKAAARRKDGERIVLAIDALDEAGSVGGNPLGLPRDLPDGVFILATQRPGGRLDTDAPRAVLRLSAESAENRADLRAYLEGAAGRTEIARALDAAGERPERFVATLVDKSQGLWAYLHHVLADIERQGTLEPEMRPASMRSWRRQV